MTALSELDVFVDGEQAPVLAGRAFFTARRGLITTTFRYADTWYAHAGGGWSISPDLPIIGAGAVDGLPGAFGDGAPDRWGRRLISRRATAGLRTGSQPTRALTDVDFLVGVDDATRQGALRFRRPDTGEFLAADRGVPQLIQLPTLLAASDRVARDHGDDLAAVKALLDAGSGSLGGARPKASVTDGERLFIAKFPHPADEWDVMAWEMVALDLAERCGIRVPTRRLVDVGGRHVLLVERFDRSGARRIPYISAMTLVGGRDGGQHDYFEIGEAIRDHGSHVQADLEQLWRRMCLSVAIRNTDDHLRNHGFLRHRNGWTLSPVFDLNPDPEIGATRATSIAYVADAAAEWAALDDVAIGFRIAASDAAKIKSEVEAAVSGWRLVAQIHGISQAEQRRFAAVLDAA